MPKKVYIIENLDCANCAAKIEAKFNALPVVEEATITFATRQLRLTAQDPDALIPKLTEIARTVEGEVTIVPREHHHEHHEHHEYHEHHHHGGCGCGHEHHEHHHHGDCGCGHHDHEGCACGHTHHEHHHHEGCSCSHDHHHHEEEHAHHHEHGETESPMPLFLGGGMFLLGLILEHFGLGLVSKLVFLGAYLVLGLEVLKTAWGNLTRGHVFDENFLMSIATLGAFCINEFPEAVGVMLFYRVGEYFEHRAVERSRCQIMEAVDLRPETVILADGHTIPAEQAKVGDLLLVRPGDRIPLDGEVVSGESRIDTAPITGEPVPVSVKPGDAVTSGCVNTAAPLTLRVERPLAESMVTRILDSVENAAASKPKIDRFITRFARIYTPAVVAIAAATAIIPSLVTGDWGYWVYTALSFLVMSCPCALVLSVPLAFFSGIGVGSKQGILFKGGLSIEALADVKAVALDKTGTVTKGNFVVQEVVGGDRVLALCAACEQYSTHPIAASIMDYVNQKGIVPAQPVNLEELSGRGIRATVEGKQILCGNRKLLEKHGVAVAENAESGTLVLVAENGCLIGHILIADTLKPGAKDVVARLETMGVASAMLTGDSDSAAHAVAEAAGIREVHAKLLPQEKLEVLRTIRNTHGTTMFVGDGINDAPVLAGADVGAAMGSGADAAIEAADVVFVTSDLKAVPESIAIARETKGIAWQNVVFALAVKFAVMILGLLGFANMWMAVFADSGVAMLCVLNSIRVLYRNR